MNQKQNDRVSYSFGMKLTTQTKYESADFHVSLTSDVAEGETNDQALDRVKAIVVGYAVKAYTEIRNAADGIPSTQEHSAQPTDGDRLPPAGNDNPSAASPQNNGPSKQISGANGHPGRDLKPLIKRAFGVLQAQKKIDAATFKEKYLAGKTLAELTEQQAGLAFVKLNLDFDNIANK